MIPFPIPWPPCFCNTIFLCANNVNPDFLKYHDHCHKFARQTASQRMMGMKAQETRKPPEIVDSSIAVTAAASGRVRWIQSECWNNDRRPNTARACYFDRYSGVGHSPSFHNIEASISTALVVSSDCHRLHDDSLSHSDGSDTSLMASLIQWTCVVQCPAQRLLASRELRVPKSIVSRLLVYYYWFDDPGDPLSKRHRAYTSSLSSFRPLGVRKTFHVLLGDLVGRPVW